LDIIAPDFGHIINGVIYEEGGAGRIEYLPPDEFDALKTSASAGARKYFSVLGNYIYLLPRLTQTPYKITFRYKSKYPVKNENGDYKAMFAKNGDASVFDDELLILGGIVKFKKELGLEYAEDMADLQSAVKLAVSNEVIKPVIAGRTESRGVLLNIPNAGIRGAR
jgi:hypothetical protein